MLTQSSLPVHISFRGPQDATVEVGGTDIASHVRTLRFDASGEPGTSPTLLVELHAYEDFEIEGAMHVETYREDASAAAELVRSIDAESLFEQLRANNSHRTSPAGLVQLVLDAVAHALDEAT